MAKDTKAKPSTKKTSVDPDRLVREVAGAYRTEDGRFGVRSNAPGVWYVTDRARFDGFGLELVLGPVTTRDATCEIIASQRSEPSGSEAGSAEPAKTPRGTGPNPKRPAPSEPEKPVAAEPAPEPEMPKARILLGRRRRTGDARDEVAAAFRRIGEAWTSGRPEKIAADLHERVVLVRSGSTDVRGRSAAIASHRDLLAKAVLREYAESDLTVELWDSAAMVKCRFSMVREVDGDRHRDDGQLVTFFERNGDRWVAVSRLQLPDQAGDLD